MLLVTKRSSTSTGITTTADEDNIPLNTDHMGLVKYESRGQEEYTIVKQRLRILVEEAKEKVGKCFAEDRT